VLLQREIDMRDSPHGIFGDGAGACSGAGDVFCHAHDEQVRKDDENDGGEMRIRGAGRSAGTRFIDVEKDLK
jgi:hypothetical protein